MAKHQLGERFAQLVEAVLLFLPSVIRRQIVGLTSLNYTIDDGACRNRFQVHFAHDSFTVSIMVDLNVLDAVVANIYANSFALSTNSSNQP